MKQKGLIFFVALFVGLTAVATATSEGMSFTPEWRVHYKPVSVTSGDYTCHAGRGLLSIAGDLKVTGNSGEWIGESKASLRGRIEPDGSFTGELLRGGVVSGRSEGDFRDDHADGMWEEFHSGCIGLWVAEPVPPMPINRPVYAEPDGCDFSGKPDQRFCAYAAEDGSRRSIMLAQDIIDRDTFLQWFGSAPPGFDRWDLAVEVLKLFMDNVALDDPAASDVTSRLRTPIEIPYGALACFDYGYELPPSEQDAPEPAGFMKGLICYQPLPEDGSRFVLLQVLEATGEDGAPSMAFESDAEAIFMSLRLP